MGVAQGWRLYECSLSDASCSSQACLKCPMLYRAGIRSVRSILYIVGRAIVGDHSAWYADDHRVIRHIFSDDAIRTDGGIIAHPHRADHLRPRADVHPIADDWIAFVFAAVGALAAWRERRVRVLVDGKRVADGPMNLIGVANGSYAGGGMMLSPEARADDGMLDVITASGLSRAHVVTELSRVHRGGHVGNPKVTITRGEIVRIETFLLQDAMPIEADGNVRGVTPVQFQIMPGALNFVR